MPANSPRMDWIKPDCTEGKKSSYAAQNNDGMDLPL